MLDVVTDLRMLEHRTESLAGRADDLRECLGLGVTARDLGARVGVAPLPPLAQESIRARAMLLTHHGEALARTALAGGGPDQVQELVRELERDAHLLRGALEAAHFDGAVKL